MKEEVKTKIEKLVNMGLQYDVDYTYILEDIKKLLDGEEVYINIQNYLN